MFSEGQEKYLEIKYWKKQHGREFQGRSGHQG